MTEKESLNFLTQFFTHLQLLQGYVYCTLKKCCLLNLELAEVQTEQNLDIFVGERGEVS